MTLDELQLPSQETVHVREFVNCLRKHNFNSIHPTGNLIILHVFLLTTVILIITNPLKNE